MKKLLPLALLFSLGASAHNIWVRPSSTQFAGDEDIILIDHGAADFPFDVNHRGRKPENLHAYSPSGQELEKENLVAGKLRTSYEVPLKEKGTYRFSDITDEIQFNYDENGEEKRWRDSTEKFKKEEPLKDRERKKLTHRYFQVETFATLGEPTQEQLKPAEQGLDLEFITHPNELYSGEEAEFRVLYNGKPLANAEVEIVRDPMRYRENNFIKFTSDGDGLVKIKWPGPGLYWLGLSHKDKSPVLGAPIDANYTYTTALEVLPL